VDKGIYDRDVSGQGNCLGTFLDFPYNVFERIADVSYKNAQRKGVGMI